MFHIKLFSLILLHPQKMLNLNEQQIRYLLSLILTFSFSCTLSSYQTFFIQIPASIIILLVAYDVFDVAYFLAGCLLTLMSLSIFYKYKHARYFIMIINMIYLLAYKLSVEASVLDISGALMFLVLKGYFLGKEYDNTHKYKSVLNYLFFIPGLMTGPTMTFTEFNNYNRKYCFNKGIRRIINSFVFLVVHVLLINKYKYSDVLENDNVLMRVLMLVMINIIYKCKFYFAWTFSYGCYTLAGIDNVKNVYPLIVEFSDSIKQIQSGWNVYTNAWLKDSIFIPMKRFGYLKASLATFFVSALWHGFNPCYFIMFLTFSVSVPIMRNNTLLMQRFLGFRITKIVNIITITLFSCFFGVPFFLLDVKETYKVWRSVHFYGVVFLLVSSMAYFMANQKRKINK